MAGHSPQILSTEDKATRKPTRGRKLLVFAKHCICGNNLRLEYPLQEESFLYTSIRFL